MSGQDPAPADGCIDPTSQQTGDAGGSSVPDGPASDEQRGPVGQPHAPAYAPPAYAAPVYAPPVPPGHAPVSGQPQPVPGYAPAYGYVPVTGRRFWALTFLFFIPYLGFLVAPIVAISLYAGGKSSPYEIVRGNARWAANWTLTVLACQVVAVLLLVSGGILGSLASASSGNEAPGIALAVCGGVLLFLIGVGHLVIAILGTVQSGSRVFDPRIAIPFIRGQR